MRRIFAICGCLVFFIFLVSCDQISRGWKGLLADTAYNQGNFDRAIVLYKELIADNPDDAHLYFKLGTVYVSKEDSFNIRRTIIRLNQMGREDLARNLRSLTEED